MMLYKLVKWMEERAKLNASIRESHGDVRFLLHKKAQVEEQMLAHTDQWFQGFPARDALRETDIPGLWVIDRQDDMELSTRVL